MWILKFAGILGFGAAIFGVSYHYNKQFLDWLRFQSLGTRDYIVEKMSVMFVEVDPNHILIGLFGLSLGLGSVVFLLLLPQLMPAIIFGFIVAFVGWKAPKPFVDFLFKRRVNSLVMQMVDGLSLMSNGMKSGLSVVQALAIVVDEMDNPIRQEFELILNQNKLGVPLEECFNNLAKRVPSDDVEMFATAINILKETGGNLAETFDTIVDTIRDRIKVEQKIQAMTAQGMTQGIMVMCVPPGMGILFSINDPKFMEPLFTTTLGWVVVMGVIMLEVVGFFVIMKIIKIDI